MAVSEKFKQFITEQLAPVGPVEIRRMFGAAAAFTGGKVFALIDDDALYFKVDSMTLGIYEREGMGPFSYPSKSGLMTMNGYRRVPDRLFDEPDAFAAFAKAAMAVADRGPEKKPRKPGGAAKPRSKK